MNSDYTIFAVVISGLLIGSAIGSVCQHIWPDGWFVPTIIFAATGGALNGLFWSWLDGRNGE